MAIFKRSKEQPVQVEERALENDMACQGGEFRISRPHKQRGALSLSSVFACCELISNSIASMDISVKNKKTRRKIDLHRLNNIFYKNKLTKFNLLKNMVLDLLLYGNGYAKIEKATDGSAVGLTYLPASQVSAFFNDNVDDTYFTYKGKRLLPSDLIHIFKNTYNGYIGVGIIQFARRSLDLANAAEDSALDFYDSGLNINGILHATEPMRKNQGQEALKALTGALSPSANNNGKIRFLPFDLKLEALSISADDAQMIETRGFNVSDIARYFNIPVSLLTENNQNAEAIMLQFLTQCITPYMVLIEDELNRKLISDPDLYFDFDERTLIRTDMKSTAVYIKTLTDAGIMTANEARELLGLPPKEGADDLVIPYTDVDQNLVNKEQ